MRSLPGVLTTLFFLLAIPLTTPAAQEAPPPSGERAPSPAGDAALRLAHELEAAGQDLLAAEQYAQVASAAAPGPEREEALFRAGRCYHRAGRFSSSRSFLETLVREFPRSSHRCEALWYWGAGLLQQNEPMDALHLLRGLVEDHPDCEFQDDALLSLGDIYRSLHRYSAAADAYQKVVDLLPPSPFAPDALYREGLALEELGRWRAADDCYASLARLYPSHDLAARAELRRAELLRRSGNPDEAEAILQRLSGSDRDSLAADASYALGLLALDRGHRREGAGRLEAFAEAYPQDERAPAAQAAAAAADLADGRAVEAAATYRSLLDAHPDAPQVLDWKRELARALAAMGERNGAEAVLLEIEQEAPATPAGEKRVEETRLARAELLLDGRRAPEGAELLEGLVESSRSAEVAREAAERALTFYERQDEPLPAVQVAGAFLSRFPAHEAAPEFMEDRARALGVAGLADRARDAWRDLATLWCEDPRGEEAEQELARFDWFRPRLTAATAESLVVLTERAGEGERLLRTDPAFGLRLADFCFETLRDYDRAVSNYSAYLAAVPADAHTPHVLFRRGEAWLRASSRMKGAAADSLRALGRQDLLRVADAFPSSPEAPRAFLAAALDSVAHDAGEADTRNLLLVDLMETLVQRYPTAPEREEALHQLARAHAELAAGHPERWTAVSTAVTALLAEFPETIWRGEVSLLRARALLARGEQGAALAQLEEVRHRAPRSGLAVEARWLAAQTEQKMERPKDVVAELDSLLATCPGSRYEEEALLTLGETLASLGDLDRAATVLNRVVDRGGPRRDQARLRLADVMAQQGDVAASLEILSRLESEGRGTPIADEAVLMRARIFERSGDLDGAVSVYHRLLDEAPSQALRVRALSSLADGLFAAGRFQEAAENYRQLLDEQGSGLEPVDLERKLVTALYRQGQGPRADEALAAFARNHPEAREAYAQLLLEKASYHVEHDEFDPAADALTRVREGEFGMQFNARASYLLGLAYLKRSRFAEAETLFARTIEADPYGDLAALASFKMGSSAYAQQQYGKAADAFHEAGERAGRTPLGADALYNRALSLEKKQDFAAARDAYQHFASEYPEHDDVTRALFKVGYCSQELGDNEAALEAYRRVLAYADPELAAEVQFWMGECYAAMGRGEDAAREFLKVAYLYPDVGEWAPTAEFRAGMHYQEMGRDDEARAIFQRLVDRYGKSRWGELARQRLDAMQAGG